MSRLGSPEGKEGPKSSIKNKALAAVMAVLGGLGATDCAISVAHVSSPGGRVTVRNGRVEACSEDPNYVDQFRDQCRQGTIETFRNGDEHCLKCDGK